MSNKSNLFPFGLITERTKDGENDMEATVRRFTREWRAWNDLQTQDTTLLSGHIDTLYEANPGVGFSRPALTTYVISKAGVSDPSAVVRLTERVASILDQPGSPYYSVKGPNGGTFKMDSAAYEIFKTTGKNPADLAHDAAEAMKAAKAKIKALRSAAAV